MTLFWAHFIIIFRSYQWTYFYIDESSCILDILRAPSSVQLIFHILPMTNNVPWPPSHILDLFSQCLAHLCWVTPIFQLASAFENWKELWKTKYFAHNLSCVPLVSYLSLLDDRSLLKNLSRGCSDQTLCHQTLAPPNQSFDSSYSSREQQKYFRKHSKCYMISFF